MCRPGTCMAALDRSRLVTAVDGLYEAAAVPALWPSALQSLATATGGSHGLILYAPPHRGWYACSPDMKECVDTFFAQNWMSSNVRAPNGIKAGRDGQVVFSDSTIFSPGELDRAPIQSEFFSRYDLRHFFGFDFVPGQVLGTIERNDHAIDQWELDEMRRALPHFRRIGQLALARGLGIADGAVAALDAVDVGAIAVDHNGRILRMNARAEAICPSVLTIREGAMRARHAKAAPAFERLVLQASSPNTTADLDFTDVVALPRQDRRPVAARAVPLKGAAQDIFQLAKAIVLLIDPDNRRRADAGFLSRVFGMTASEARVAERLARGESVAEIAATMNISVETVRTHLKAVFLKTGTRRQAELSALLGRLS